MKWHILALLTVGCIPSNAEIINDGQRRLDDLTSQAHEEVANLKTIWESELEKASNQLRESLIFRQCDGSNTPQCGLTVPAMMSGYVDFVEVYCVRVTQDFCQAWHESKILEALQLRYQSTDSPQVGESLGAFEERLIKEHNEKVYYAYEQKCRELNAEYTKRVNSLLAEYQEGALLIQEQVTQDIKDAKQDRAILRGVASALAAGTKAYGETMAKSYKSPYQSPQTEGCTSDYTCPSGQWCVKGVGQTYGTCAHVVNRFGTPTYSPPRPSSFQPGRAQCRNSLECPYGFRCDQGNCTN